jgi:hypothetical protein
VLVPLTLGWTRMRVVVPERAARELDFDERRAMLAHELAHARRRDPLWISAARVVEGLCFFQPLNRLARINLQDEAEFLADRWAIGRGVEPLALASCLTEVAGWIVSSRRALPVPSMAARGARLTRRVERTARGAPRAPLAACARLPAASPSWRVRSARPRTAVPGQAPRGCSRCTSAPATVRGYRTTSPRAVHGAPPPSSNLLRRGKRSSASFDPRWHRRFTEAAQPAREPPALVHAAGGAREGCAPRRTPSDDRTPSIPE